ncbi:MAG: CopG family transcriptional regulator [Gammaproteobacteria bacterium]|nr:CopG family transcriptional regulator [Gammaproteobacteria bacterium]
MGQVTIYLEDEVEQRMVEAAKAAHLSKSKWISGLIRSKVANEWPQSVVELAGSWKDFPSIEEIRSGIGSDLGREEL